MAPSNQHEFDGYRKWLGISNKKRPPTHYELLAISLDEDDPEVIVAAAEQRRHFVESKRGDGHDDLVAEILYRIDEAQATLLNNELRRGYDRQLDIFEKRQKSRQIDPNAPRSRIKPRPGRTVGEGTGFVGTFAGILGVFCVALGLMAWFSFQLPWSKVTGDGDVAPVVQVPEFGPDPVVQGAAGPIAAPERIPPAAPPVDDRVGELVTFERHTGAIWCLAFSPDGKLALSGQGKIPGTAAADQPTEYPLILWEVETGRELRSFKGHTDTVRAIAFSADGQKVASGSWDKTIRLWDVNTGQQLHVLEGHDRFVTGVVFTPDGNGVFSGNVDKTAKLWDVNSGKVLRSFAAKGQVHCVALHPDGGILLTGETLVDGRKGDNTISLWDAESGERTRTLKGVRGEPHMISFSPDGRQILSATGLGWVTQLWDVESGDELKSFEGHSCCFTPVGKHAVANSKDNGLVLWDLKTGSERQRFYSHDKVVCVAVSADGRRALTGSMDMTVKVWGLPSLQN